jgi:hypothetical protein
MKAKIKSFIENVTRPRELYNPSTLNDEIASRTEWTSLSTSSTNFKTHNLIEKGPNRMEFKTALGAKIFVLLFMGVGLAVPVIFQLIPDAELGSGGIWPLYIFGGIFFLVGAVMHYIQSSPIVFDKLEGFYWGGRKKPELHHTNEQIKNAARIRNIYAIQILSRRVSSSKSSYTCYEINLVLRDESRLNVIAHAGGKAIKENAETLGRFLGVPVWDAT